MQGMAEQENVKKTVLRITQGMGCPFSAIPLISASKSFII
jgi:hypothetical protein